MGDVLDHFVIDMFCELHGSLGSAGGAHSSALARECDEERVFTAVAVRPDGAVSEHSAVKVLVVGLQYLIPQAPVLMLEPGLPLELEVVPRVVHDLVEHQSFRCSSPVVLELLRCFLPRVAPEHAGWFGGITELGCLGIGEVADRDSGEFSGGCAHTRSHGGGISSPFA